MQRAAVRIWIEYVVELHIAQVFHKVVGRSGHGAIYLSVRSSRSAMTIPPRLLRTARNTSYPFKIASSQSHKGQALSFVTGDEPSDSL